MISNLFDVFDPGDAHIENVADRLSDRAERSGDLDVAYRTLETPIGTLLLAATDAGLVRVAFEWSEPDALDVLARTVSPRILRAPRRLDPVACQLDEYFAQSRRAFDLPLDLRLAHGFRRHVLDELRRVGYGVTVSYADLARTSGSPRAARAVGTACATNPLPLVVPCHRVVRSDGSLGNYGGGVEAKRALLALEGATAGADTDRATP